MKDKLVEFLTAKLAKEKGFNEKCTHYYVLDFSTFKSNGILKQHGTPIEDNENILQLVRITEHQPHLASAPTQSLLQKWIREVHNIHLVIQYSKHWKGYQWRYDDWRNREDNPNMKRNSYDEYKTYEEALEMGLQESLNLIKK